MCVCFSKKKKPIRKLVYFCMSINFLFGTYKFANWKFKLFFYYSLVWCKFMYIFDCSGGMSYFESILCKIKLYQLWYFGWLAFSLDWVQLDYKNALFFPSIWKMGNRSIEPSHWKNSNWTKMLLAWVIKCLSVHFNWKKKL